MSTLTLYILLSITILLVGYDIYAYIRHNGSTISETIYAAAKRYPIFPFALGVLLGHLLWTQ